MVRYRLETNKQPQKAPAMSVYRSTKDASTEQHIFDTATRKFLDLTNVLQASSSLELTHDALERLIDSKGTEILRELLQGHMELRSIKEPLQPVTGADGVTRTHKRSRKRNLVTVFGEIEVNRYAWSVPEYSALHPLDASLNLPTSSFSYELQRKICSFVISNSFDRTVELVAQNSGATVAKRQVLSIASQATVDFDAFYQGTVIEEETSQLLVLSFDQKGIIMRPEALRKATREAAKKAKREA